MTHLTPKENFMVTLRGEIPEWVPSFSYYGPLPGVDEVPPNMSIRLGILAGNRGPTGGFDMWGVPYESVDLVGGFSLPKPGEFILKDIRDWPNVIKAPDLSGIDWDAYIAEELSKLPYSRDEVALVYGPCGGLFMHLMGFMGFTEGLCAIHEEPEIVYELFAYMADFYMGVAKNALDRIKPDIINLSDDTASERAPFMSPQAYHDLILPFYAQFSQMGVARNQPVNMHNCGKSECFFDDLVRVGVTSWEPVQLINDIKEMQRKYGRHLVIGGGWEGRGRLTEPDVTDEEIRESVRVCLDTYARDGGFMFAGAYTPGKLNDERTAHWNAVLQKEVYDYGHTFYK